MATKHNTPKQEPSTVLKIGNLQIETVKVVEVGGYKVELQLKHTPSEEPTLNVLNALLKSNPSPDVLAFEVNKALHNSRYLPILPKELVQGQMRVQGKIWDVPLASLVWELYCKVKACNPMDRGREGNVNQVIVPNGKISAGSFALLCLGISGSRYSPTGGMSGGYSPCKIFEGVAPLTGYDFQIVSMSEQYSKALKLLNERKAKEALPQPKQAKKQGKK